MPGGRPRRFDEQVQMTVRVTPEFAELLQDWADAAIISRADCVRVLLEYSLDALKKGEVEMVREAKNVFIGPPGTSRSSHPSAKRRRR